jgi:Flp pilus assembly protein TadG
MLSRLRRDQSGLAGVEFALIAPLMILLYYGMVELTLGMMAERRASHAASVVADLVSQTASTTGAEMDDIFSVGAAILRPFPATSLKMRIASVTRTNSVNKVVWSRGYGQSGRGVGTTASLPANLLADNESIILAEVTYTYDSPVHQVLPIAKVFNDTFYLRPRKSSEVACPSC